MPHNGTTERTTSYKKGMIIIPTQQEVKQYGEPLYCAENDPLVIAAGHPETKFGELAGAVCKRLADIGKKMRRAGRIEIGAQPRK